MNASQCGRGSARVARIEGIGGLAYLIRARGRRRRLLYRKPNIMAARVIDLAFRPEWRGVSCLKQALIDHPENDARPLW
jgi:hypothetical protein